jgi:hypothetical protein
MRSASKEKPPTRRDLLQCAQVGTTLDWSQKKGPQLGKQPVCNRPKGHPGAHRTYAGKTAEILAEWLPKGAK